MRKPFQGVANIIRFNWHFYALSLVILLLLYSGTAYVKYPFREYIYLLCILILTISIISLAISYYVYDLSGLYAFNWLKILETEKIILNIHAGFDESSISLSQKFKDAELVVFDFYDPLKHTEISIKRARKAYPPYPETLSVKTNELPMADDSADKIFVILSAHEIRDESERLIFFRELRRVIKPNGHIFIVEHLRDAANLLAYNVGFFHFYSKFTWLHTFTGANLKLKKEIKLTPFISTFILTKNGNTP